MTDQIEYRRWWMENTTSRNAFYQVFDIIRRNANGTVTGHAVAMHYGVLKIAEGDFSRPVKGGNVHVKTLALANTFNDAIGLVASKTRKDYVQKVIDAQSKKTTEAWITQHFGAVYGRDVRLALGITEPISDIDAPIVRVDDSLIDRGPVWGSW